MDNFAHYTDTISSPARRAFAVTPHNVNELPEVPKALYVGTGGDVTLRPVDSDADVVLKNVGSGQVLDIRPSHIRATGTTAADIVALA